MQNSSEVSSQDDEWMMTLCLEEALKAWKAGEVPVGALLVSEDGQVIIKTHNQKETNHDPCAHAEILALTGAGKENKSWRLIGATLFVTLEPCVMCLGAMINARISRLVFGAYDPKGGAISLGYNFFKDTRLNHNFRVMGGVKHFEASKMLSDFFKERRVHFVEK